MDRSPASDEAEWGDVCSVLAAGALQVPVDAVAGLRKVPGRASGRRSSTSLLKHADDQTVLGVSAVLRTIEQSGWQDRDFSAWGVVAAPRFPGRLSLAPSLEKFQQRGPASVSPLIIPNLSLHAMAGSISLAINAHGTNFGVGGGHGHLIEALLCALTIRPDTGCGLWVVATQWNPEPIPDTTGASVIPAAGVAVALALAPQECAEPARYQLRVQSSPEPCRSSDSGLIELSNRLVAQNDASARFRWASEVPGGGFVVLEESSSRGFAAGLTLGEPISDRFLDVA